MIEPIDDRILLERFVKEKSEDAFRTLSMRYADLVYGACVRRLGRRDAAEDATQAVFLILSRKAPQLLDHPCLAPWLYACAVKVCKTASRAEGIRMNYERQAASQVVTSALEDSIKPWLDPAIAKLRPADQSAIVLRFLQGNTLKEVGAALGVEEDAARMRVNRALESLRKDLTRLGFTVTVAGLAAALPRTADAAPPELRQTLSLWTASGQPSFAARKLAKAQAHGIPALAVPSFVGLAILALFGGARTSTTHVPAGAPTSGQVSTPPKPAAVVPQNSRAARSVSAKEALTRLVSEFEGHWTWTSSTDLREVKGIKSDAVVTLNRKTGALEIEGKGPDGRENQTTAWTADPEKGTWLMGSTEGQPLVMKYVSGSEQDGNLKMNISYEDKLSKQKLTVDLSHERISFVEKFVPKPGSSAPGELTIKMLFERVKP